MPRPENPSIESTILTFCNDSIIYYRPSASLGRAVKSSALDFIVAKGRTWTRNPVDVYMMSK